jgi:parallel beta-helix repeat protein
MQGVVGMYVSKKIALLTIITLLGVGGLGFHISTATGIIWVGGHITSDTTWTAGNTYRVINNTYVDHGVTLTIQHGARVEFADGVSLTVNGSLYAVGTIEEMIVFTSSRSDPFPGTWETIRFVGAEGEYFMMNYCAVSFAKNGVTIQSLGKAVIENSRFINCSETGIYAIESSNITISGNMFDFSSYGIFIEGQVISGIVIENNSIDVEQDGIFLRSLSDHNSSVCNISIQVNQIISNGKGIQVYGGSFPGYGYIPDVIIQNLTIRFNQIIAQSEGIYIYNTDGLNTKVYEITVQNNIINTKQTGIYVYGKYGSQIRNITIQDNQIISNGDGVYFYGQEGYNTDIREITIKGNQISSNSTGIYLHGYGINYANIHKAHIVSNDIAAEQHGVFVDSQGNIQGSVYNLTIESNQITTLGDGIHIHGGYIGGEISNSFIQSNRIISKGNGLFVHVNAHWAIGFIHNVTIQDNWMLMNGQNGIYILADGSGSYESRVYNIAIQNNSVSASLRAGLCITALNYLAMTAYDVVVMNNFLSANEEEGILIVNVKTNITHNSISYNFYGIKYVGSNGNSAQLNDIYRNTFYGMYVTESATVAANYNYWGDLSGPYHESINPEGRGNKVNGNGTDLDFVPFLGSPIGFINERPIAALNVEKTIVDINENLTFDASQSHDDGKIIYYFFDFGDGTNSSWISLPIVTHKYALNGTYNVTVIVMDDYGVKSVNSEIIKVQIIVVQEYSSAIIPLLIIGAFTLTIILPKRCRKKNSSNKTN